jgi:hypothetical protein
MPLKGCVPREAFSGELVVAGLLGAEAEDDALVAEVLGWAGALSLVRLPSRPQRRPKHSRFNWQPLKMRLQQ